MTPTTPRFSILMPTHNRADVLGLAIASVLAQSEADFELLVVADGCTDHTREVVASFADARIRLFDLPKGAGFGYANRNIALRQARGRLIAFAAHDDLMLPDHLAHMGDLLERNGASWGYSRPLWVSTDGIIVPFCTNLTLADELRGFETGNTIPAGCVVHTRAALEQAGYWPEDIAAAADWVLWRRMIAHDKGKIAYTRQPTHLHFSASWKQSRHSLMAEVKQLLAIADQEDWWPSILRHPPSGEPEQAGIWRAIQSGGKPWVSELRAAIDVVVDRLAWRSVRELCPRLEIALSAQAAAESRAQAEQVRAETAEARAGEAEARAGLAQSRAEVAEAAASASAAAASAAAAQVMALRSSRSWRVTAPAREIGRFLRRLR